MRPEQHIELAKRLVKRIEEARSETVKDGKRDVVSGADPNELKKLFTFLIAHQDMKAFRQLIDRIPSFGFGERSNQTRGYFSNIRTAFQNKDINFFNMKMEDALQVLGWTCRLLKRPGQPPGQGRPQNRFKGKDRSRRR